MYCIFAWKTKLVNQFKLIMKKSICFRVLLFVIGLQNVFGQTVTNNTQLQAAISAASAGSTITLANGTWNNIYLSINKTANATNPIKIVAQTPGQVFFEGNSRISLGGAYIIFEGVVFKNPSSLVDNGSTLEPVIEFRSSNNTACSNCIVRNIKIESYNGTTAQSQDTFKWIILYGQYNEVSYSSFTGKYGVGSIINDNRDIAQVNYHKIHHNYFADRTPVGVINDLNDQDAIRIGTSATSLSDSYTEVYNNLFNNWSGEVEIISNKSGKNKYYNNTFRNYQGTLTLRHGNDCEVFGNYFFANNNIFSGGIRIIGENHKVYNNYIEGVNSIKPDGSTTKTCGGINISNGRVNSALNGYYQVKNTIITNNTFVNCDFGIRMGTDVSSDLTLAPLNVTVANNIMLNSSNKAINQVTAPTGTSIYQGNIRQTGSWDITTGTNNNIAVTSGLLTSGTDFYRVQTGSTAINYGNGTYAFLTKDILGGNRPTTGFDAGAEEFGTNGTNLPYVVSNVGNTIGFLSYPNNLTTEHFLTDNKLVLYPNPASNLITIESETVLNTVEIYDYTGKKVYSKNINSSKTSIDVSTFSKGLYLVKTNNSFSRVLIK